MFNNKKHDFHRFLQTLQHAGLASFDSIDAATGNRFSPGYRHGDGACQGEQLHSTGLIGRTHHTSCIQQNQCHTSLTRRLTPP